MDNITTTADFNKLLNSCYFHPEREYPSMMIKLRARMVMTLLWQASEITVRNFKFKQKDIRRILIDEMMPEDFDRRKLQRLFSRCYRKHLKSFA